MGERLEVHVISGAEARAEEVSKTLGEAYAKKDGFALTPAQVVFFAQLAFDLKRLVGEVRRLVLVHERATDLITAAMDHAYHQQAKLLRNGTGPYVPNVTEEAASKRWSETQALLRDNHSPFAGLGLVAEQAERERVLRARLEAARADYAHAERILEVTKANAETFKQEVAGVRAELADVESQRDALLDEARRLRRKVNALLDRLRAARTMAADSVFEGMLKLVARAVVKEMGR